MNNGFAFLGRTLGEKYNYKEPSKTKSDEKSNYPIIENKDSSVSKNDDDKKKNESKIITNLSKVNFVSESSSNTEKNEVPKDSIENIEKSDSKKSDNEKVIKYDPGNILTSNNAYSKNATIKIERYTDNSCKTKVQNETNTFYGNESCWNVADNYSFRPLYYEDNNDRIYYHAYNLKGCKSNVFTPFVLNENYFICDSKCRKPKGNETFYYKCDFTAGENLYVLNSLYLYLILYIIIFIF